uniref:Caspase recruitment domain family, member 14 n=1 Tax=Xiphophorus couchianus TaxID=32473 RepID=A0A3B5M5V1_9TELE
MAEESVPEGRSLKELSEEELWELINDNRHRISLGVRPCILLPYLRQVKVLTEVDEDEILSCHNLTNRCMRTYMLDLLRTQGRNGAVALLEGLMIHYPVLYTHVTGRKPSTEPSRFSLIKYSELTEYLIRAVTGMQTELQEARNEAGKMSTRCSSLESEVSQLMEQEEKCSHLQTENERLQRHLEVTKLKDEKCDLYIRYTTSIEEKSLLNQTEALSLQVQQLSLDCKMQEQKSTVVQSQMKELQVERDQAYQSRDDAQAMIARILAEKDTLRSQLVELQEAVSKSSAPPFLVRSRPKAIRVNGRVLSLSLQCEALLSELSIVGGNKSGVFVHQVTEGGAAHAAGISPGAQIVELQVRYEQNSRALRMVLEDSTLEEAMWALGQVTGFCQLSLRPRQNYEALLQQLQNSTMSSGDSFYIRVNLSLPAGASGTLAVSCNNILHVTNTRPAGTEDLWQASQVHPCQLLDLQSGTVPNYYQKAVRIVSTGRQGRNPLWVSVDEENTNGTESCVTLMPYTLVTPHFPPVCRPILLLPTILGRMLDKKLASWQGFQLMLTASEHAARLQRSEILEEVEPGGNRCYTLQSVEKVMKKGLHCVLPLGLDCVRRLHRSEIFPVIIFSKLQRSGQTEEQLLACSKSEEPLLDKLPCLYHSMAPDSWCDRNSLLTSLRTIIWEEQRKVVWVEPDLW